MIINVPEVRYWTEGKRLLIVTSADGEDVAELDFEEVMVFRSRLEDAFYLMERAHREQVNAQYSGTVRGMTR